MKIDWVLIGWIIDMILNGVVWLVIVALALPLIDKTDKWTRKAVKLMGSADDFIRKVLEDIFELIEKKNLQILAAFVLIGNHLSGAPFSSTAHFKNALISPTFLRLP